MTEIPHSRNPATAQPPDVSTRPPLRKSDLFGDPFQQFKSWFEELLATNAPEPTAMTLATADADGAPSARIVLLKGYDTKGFVFFTNYESRKGRDLTVNPRAALVFFWPTLERQIRLEGPVERVSRAESEEYFRSRPEGSRIGAWVSRQSEVLPNRQILEDRFRLTSEEFSGREIPLPPFWGGFRLMPGRFEFWQSRRNRLHDRFQYCAEEGGRWRLERLAP